MEGIYKAIENRDLEAYLTAPAVLDPDSGDLGKGMGDGMTDLKDDLHGRVSLSKSFGAYLCDCHHHGRHNLFCQHQFHFQPPRL